MTQEEKELLLKDLNARLSYGVKVHCEWNQFQGDRISEDGELVSINIYDGSIHFKRNSGRITEIPFNRIDGTVLPYLHPMSSMTEEEREELSDYLCEKVMPNKIGITIPPNPTQGKGIPFIWMGDCLDWLNKKGFDYRGLIPMGLALEAPEGMYNN